MSDIWFTGPPIMIQNVEFYFWKPNPDSPDYLSTHKIFMTEKIIVVKMTKVFPNIADGDVVTTCCGKCQLLDNYNAIATSLLGGLWNGPIRIPT
jgi:hypothetical protein